MKDVRGKIAPEDSSKWKCKWLTCENGGGLAGHGYCPSRGEWNNSDCPNFREASCQHNVKVSQTCLKCEKLNLKIEIVLSK